MHKLVNLRLTRLVVPLRRFSLFSGQAGLQKAKSLSPEDVQKKAQILQEQIPYFDRLMYFDPDYLSHIPFFFKPLQPFINLAKDAMISFNAYIGMPWWLVIVTACGFLRLTLLPLIFLQYKRIQQLAPIAPVLVHLKDTFKASNLPFRKKLWTAIKIAYSIVKMQNLKMYRLVIYNIANFPIIISMIYAIRQLLSIPEVGNTSFLYLPALKLIDPYFILPFLTVAMYYWNFQRFITPQNKHTLISRIRGVCQIFIIMWFPFLCYWPSGIVLYMFTNSVISVIQTTVLTKPFIMLRLNPKIAIYSYLLGIAQYDKAKSQALVQSIKTGDQSLIDKAVSEQKLVQQTKDMVKRLNKQKFSNQPIEEDPLQEENRKGQDK